MPGADQLVEVWQEVVAADDTDTHTIARARALEYGANRRRAGGRIHPAGVGDDLDASLDDGGEHAFDRADEVPRVAHGRVALLLLLQNRHRDFGEIVEHHVVNRSALHLAPWRVEGVAPESLRGRNSDDPGCIAHARSDRTNGPRCGPGF